jgi:hypothetical protein
MKEVQHLIEELSDKGAIVLSPQAALPWRTIAGGFLLLEGDRQHASILRMDDPIRRVEDRHLDCIRQSDFICIAGRDGYVGDSVAFEIGVAIACGVQIYAFVLPLEVRLACWVTIVPDVNMAVLNHTTERIGAQ